MNTVQKSQVNKPRINVSIEETEEAMLDLLYGNQAPNEKLAWWSSALSLQTPLPRNCSNTRVMTQWVDSPLPENRQEIKDALCGVMWSTVNTLYAIEALCNARAIDFDCGDTLESQRAWREKMVAIIPGMASKLVSWALFIYNPLGCLLTTVDCHHANRMGIVQATIAGSSKAKLTAYYQAENRLIAECQALYPEKLYTVVAACLWLNYRNEGITSHRGISCRWY